MAVTLDPVTVTNGTLSNGNLTFTGTPSGSVGGAFSTLAHAASSGKWYFEVTLGTKGTNGNGWDGFGVAGPTATFTTLTSSAGGHGCICFDNNGDIYVNGSQHGNANGGGSNPNTGFTYGIGIDTGALTMQIQNLSTGGTLQTGIVLPSETSFNPACCVFDSTVGSVFTFNFGATAFVGTLPSGYSAWGGASNDWASVEAPDVFSAVGYPGFFGTTGQLAAIENPDIATIVGVVPPVGGMLVTENPDIFSAFGTQPVRGTLITTERPDRMTAAGIGYGEDGIWFSTEAPDIFAAAGFGPVTGAFVTTEAADRFQAFGAGVTRVRRRRNLIVT